MMIDLDHFKEINDSLGHSEGDKALIQAANILRQSAADREWLFRFAGDEFIILKRSDSPDGLSPYIRRVEDKLVRFNSEDHPYRLNMSYGTSFYNSGNIDLFMKEMDDNMYNMKEEHHRKYDLGKE